MSGLPTRAIRIVAISNADELGYLGQHAITEAVPPEQDYRIVGGHMVRLLLEAYPTPEALPRSTLDADAAVGDVEVIGPLVKNLIAAGFTKTGGNVLVKDVGRRSPVEINLLLSELSPSKRMRTRDVAGVGQVDTLPELHVAMNSTAVELDVTAELRDGTHLHYCVRIPNLEAAVMLKAHAWKARHRQGDKDLADLNTLFEIRHAHSDVPWRLAEPTPQGFRKDSALALHELADTVTRRSAPYPVPVNLDRRRLAALIKKHVAPVN